MTKNKFTLYFVFISFLTFVTIFFSILQKSYFSLQKPQKLVENNALLKEFDSSLDLSVISAIESKNKNIEENFDFSVIKSGNEKDLTPNLTLEPTIQPTLEPTTTPVNKTSEETPVETLNETTP